MLHPNKPRHVAIADEHSRKIFDWLLQDRRTIERAFDLTIDRLDLDLAWETFDKLAYNAAFEVTGGDADMLRYPMVSNEVLDEVLRAWPEIYFMEYCVKAGFSDRFDIGDKVIYVVKPGYKDKVNAILKASDTKSGV